MSARVFSASGKLPGRMRPDAKPLAPHELIRLRAMIRDVAEVPAIDAYLESAEVARMLGLHKRTVLDLAHAGEFDGDWGKAFKPAYNRVRIPKTGVQVYIERRAVFSRSAEPVEQEVEQ